MMGNFMVVTKKVILKSILLFTVFIFVGITSFNKINNMIEVSTKNRLLPIYSVETNKKQVALTFDCAWGADDIASIVEVLNKNNVNATFFVVGDWVKKYPDAVKLLSDADMEIRKSHL